MKIQLLAIPVVIGVLSGCAATDSKFSSAIHQKKGAELLMERTPIAQPAIANPNQPEPTEPKTTKNVEVNTDGFTNTPIIPGTKWHMHDPNRPQPAVVTPGVSPTLGAPPPSDAELLFDGKDLSKWQQDNGTEANWKMTNGYVESIPASGRPGGIRTRGKWADFQLHLEWATPTPARGEGQGRGNSGILINNMYEVQVLDSYHSLTYPDGLAGAIYGQMPPLVNACLPPGEWQTYDIFFESPRWNEQGELVKKAVITVIQNGVIIQDHYELTGCTDGIGAVPWKSLGNYARKHPPELFVELQYHNNAVRYRNIWIRSMHPGENL